VPIRKTVALLGSNPPEVTAILDDLRRIVQVLREASRDAERHLGVTGAQLFVLKALLETPRLSLNELAERTHTHQSTVSVVAKRLVDRGLVTRSVSPHDGRRIELSLTVRGRRLLARSPLAAQDQLIAGVDALGPAERRGLAVALRRLAEAMRVGDEAPVMFFEEELRGAPHPRQEPTLVPKKRNP
jgi:DNA-binding MarR family transcriptional regulator